MNCPPLEGLKRDGVGTPEGSARTKVVIDNLDPTTDLNSCLSSFHHPFCKAFGLVSNTGSVAPQFFFPLASSEPR